MIAWLINHTILYVIVFFWGYFTLKLFYQGFFGIIVALILGFLYYDISSKGVGFFVDVIFIVGALDYKFYLREQVYSYMSFAWQVGVDNIKDNFYRGVQLIKNKFTSQLSISDKTQNFDKNWYDEALKREQQKAQQAEEKARKANEQAKQAKQAKDEAEREKYKQQQKEKQDNKKRLDPTKLQDAYVILGVEYGADKETCKLHFRKLMSMYHPDKLADFADYRRKQMEQEAKDIGVAWETVERNSY